MRPRDWTPEEDEILRTLYPATDVGAIASNHLPGRSARAITTRASRLGLRKAVASRPLSTPWTEDELATLKNHYEEKGPTWLHANLLPGRSAAAIMTKASTLGLHTGRVPWTESENDVIRDTYGKMHPKEIARLLPGRTTSAVCQQARTLGLSSPVTGRDTIHGASVLNGVEHGTNVGAHRTDKPLPTNSTTGIRGVCYDKHSKKYIAHICFKRQKRSLGYFDSLDEAVAARRAAEDEIGREVDRIADDARGRAEEILEEAYKKPR